MINRAQTTGKMLKPIYEERNPWKNNNNNKQTKERFYCGYLIESKQKRYGWRAIAGARVRCGINVVSCVCVCVRFASDLFQWPNIVNNIQCNWNRPFESITAHMTLQSKCIQTKAIAIIYVFIFFLFLTKTILR